ncbi:MAG: hypothetical protein AB1413_12550 [Thermodesulfobacteriota bacterium]
MAKKTPKIDVHPGQMSLLDLLVAARAQLGSPEEGEGCCNLRERLRLALCAAIKQCPLSRWEIAGQMSHLVGCEVSKYMLDAWTAESKDGHRMPAEYLPAFCKVTGDLAPLRIMAETAGLFALPGPDALRSEIRRLDEEAKRIREEKRKRELFLREMEK